MSASSAGQDRYTSVAIALHWLIAALIIGQIAGGLYMHQLPATSWKFDLYQWHKSFGILILALSLFRLGWRLTHRPPALPAGMASWEKLGARLSHAGFYVLMICVPLIGWAMVSASPRNVPTVLFKILPLPHLPGIPRSEAWADALAELHEYMAFAILGLLALHVAAALKHHFLDRDGVLTHMIPVLKKRS